MLFQKNNKTAYIIAFTLFVFASLYGLLIRWNFAFPILSFPYKNVLQSHSHVAFLGWGYIFVITIISQYYLTIKKQKSMRNWFVQLILTFFKISFICTFNIPENVFIISARNR